MAGTVRTGADYAGGMKVTASSDWRDDIPFETPTLVADLVPGEPARCSGCTADAAPHPRTELWAVKHRHPRHHAGYVRFYCLAHRPEPRREPVEQPRPAARSRSAARPERTTTPRRPAVTDAAPRAMCPDCFVEVSATGICGMCGQQVA
jgi:hypothetical protein